MFINVEQEIWDEFKQLSEYDINERMSYGEAKSHFGIKYEDNIPRVNRINEHQYILHNEDDKINEAIRVSESPAWDKVLKAYPQRPEIILPKGITYPKPKFRSRKEGLEISNLLLDDWDNVKEKIHSRFPNDNIAREYLFNKKWGNSAICPRCGCGKIYILTTQKQKYKCANCRYRFSELIGTIFQNSLLPLLKWYEGIYLLTSIKTSKISTPQLADALEVTQKTSWGMVSKIRSKVNDKLLHEIKFGLFKSI